MKFLKSFSNEFSRKEKDYYGSKSIFDISNDIETYKDLTMFCRACWVSKKLVNPILDILLDINKKYSLVTLSIKNGKWGDEKVVIKSKFMQGDDIIVSFSLQDIEDDYLPEDIANDIIEYVNNRYNSQGYKVVKSYINDDRVDFEILIKSVSGNMGTKKFKEFSKT